MCFQTTRNANRVSLVSSLFASMITQGDFPAGTGGCHAAHRASFAVTARPSGKPAGSGFPSLCRNIKGTLAASVNGCAAFTAPENQGL
ncbi:MAG: hypothetical protein XXXJIFNMEKO3_LKCDNKCA_00157 (plasmid) [Candidatus Erwinia impunctatus]